MYTISAVFKNYIYRGLRLKRKKMLIDTSKQPKMPGDQRI